MLLGDCVVAKSALEEIVNTNRIQHVDTYLSKRQKRHSHHQAVFTLERRLFDAFVDETQRP